jgi:hypothetical protein
MQTVYGLINNVIGLFVGVGAAPPATAKTATITASMAAKEIADTSNALRLGVYADFGAGPVWQAWAAVWQGGPGQVQPSFTWTLPQLLPVAVHAVVQNGTGGANSPAVIDSLNITFA